MTIFVELGLREQLKFNFKKDIDLLLKDVPEQYIFGLHKIEIVFFVPR